MTERSRRLLLWVGLFCALAFFCRRWMMTDAFANILQVSLKYAKRVDPDLITQVMASSATIIAAVLVVVCGQFAAKSREIREAHREKKTKIYNKFIESVKNTLAHGSSAGQSRKLIKEMLDFNSDLVLYGAPRVVRAHLKWMKLAQAGHAGTRKSFLLIDQLYREFRKDIGLSTTDLRPGDLVRLYLKADEWGALQPYPLRWLSAFITIRSRASSRNAEASKKQAD